MSSELACKDSVAKNSQPHDHDQRPYEKMSNPDALSQLRSKSVFERKDDSSSTQQHHRKNQAAIDADESLDQGGKIISFHDQVTKVRRNKISEICGHLSLQSIRLKSEKARFQIKLFTEAQAKMEGLPENRACLLEWLQFSCQ